MIIAKPVLGVYDKARLKPVSLASERLTRELKVHLKHVYKVLISLRGYTGLYVSFLLVHLEDRVSRIEANEIIKTKMIK